MVDARFSFVFGFSDIDECRGNHSCHVNASWTFFWQFSDDLKYLSSCHKEWWQGQWWLPQSALCKEMPLSFKLLLLQLSFTYSTAADKLRFMN